MEDLWLKTEDLDCDVCAGVNDRCCGGMVPHYRRYVYRVIGPLENFLMPEDVLLRFVRFMIHQEAGRRMTSPKTKKGGGKRTSGELSGDLRKEVLSWL